MKALILVAVSLAPSLVLATTLVCPIFGNDDSFLRVKHGAMYVNSIEYVTYVQDGELVDDLYKADIRAGIAVDLPTCHDTNEVVAVTGELSVMSECSFGGSLDNQVILQAPLRTRSESVVKTSIEYIQDNPTVREFRVGACH